MLTQKKLHIPAKTASLQRMCKALLLYPLLAALALILGACKGDSPIDSYTKKKILVLGNSAEPQGLDPQIVTGVPENNIIRSIFEGLCVEHPSQEGVHLPGAAESWEANDDFTHWTFHLRRNGQWSDGTPLTAEDFLFAFQRILHPNFGAEYASMLYYIKGAEQYNKGKPEDFAKVAASAPDPYTLHIQLKAPIPFLPELTKHYSWFPVPKHIILKHGTIDQRNTPWTEPENIVSNGAFTLERWRFNDYISVVKNPRYWDQATVKLRGIRFLPISNQYTEARMFFNQQLHSTYSLAPEMIEHAANKYPQYLRQETYLGTSFIRFNVTDPKLNDLKVRQALALSVDSQAIIDHILKGGQTPAYGIVPPTADYHTPKVVTFDPERARELLAEASYRDGKKLRLTLLSTDKEVSKRLSEAYQDMWKKHLGAEVSIEQREWKTYLARMAELDFQLVLSGWIGDYPDPTTFLDMWKKDDGNNRTGWSNPEYEALLAQAEQIKEPAQRLRTLEKAEALFLSEMPIIPIYWYTTNYLLHTSVKGWEPLLLNNHPYKFVDLELPTSP